MSVKSFVFGLLLGASLVAGVGVLASGDPPKIVGDSGILTGYEVVDRNGRRICVDPDYMSASKIISCE